MATIKVKRGTRSEINTAASASGLNQGELYLITDEDVLAVGTSSSTYEDINSAGLIDLTTDVTGTLPVANGGTGVTALSSLDAADLGSGAATDGYVLTADGAGNAAWEAASGAILPIDLLSSGASIRKSDGTTAVLSESGGDVNLTNISSAEVTNIQATSGQSLTIKDEDGNAAIIIGTDNTAHTYLSLNFGSYHGDSGGAGSGTRTGNTLDDYEEGTWTPTVNFGGSAWTGIYFVRIGSYTKIGNLVTLQCQVQTNSAPGVMTGNVTITGLPFPNNGTVQFKMPISVDAASGTTTGIFAGTISTSSSTLGLFLYEDGDSQTAVTHSNYGIFTNVNFSICYRN